MYLKLIFTVCLALFGQQVFAETCPSVRDVKNNTLPRDWIAYDSDDGSRLSLQREQEFKRNAEEFVLAEWTSHKNKGGSIHCYYRNKSGSNLEAYIAKNNFIPEDPKQFWYNVSDARHCVAGTEKCKFMSRKPLASQHLAKK